MEKKNRASIIIIIVLVALIAAAGTVLAVTTISDKNSTGSSTSQTVQDSTAAAEMTDGTLDKELMLQPMYADGVKYYYATSSPQLEHDAMGATVMNNSDVNITSFVIAFCAFDADNNPIKIKQPGESTDGAYIRTITYDLTQVNGDKKYITPGESFDNVVFYVNNEPQIVTIKACVKSYESVDKITWKNPLYDKFKENYSGKKLN